MINDINEQMRWEANVSVGDRVGVRWGYGSGFRAMGRGKIVKIFKKSYRVELLEDVMLGESDIASWHRGFVVKGVHRCTFGNLHNWNPGCSILPL